MKRKTYRIALLLVFVVLCIGTLAYFFGINSVPSAPFDEQAKKTSDEHMVSSVEWRLFQQPQDNQRLGSVTLAIVQNSVMNADTFFQNPNADFILRNDSDYEIDFASPVPIKIQRRINEKWYEWFIHPGKDDAGVGCILMPADETKLHISMKELFPETQAAPGTYRACLPFDYCLGTDDMGGNLYESSYAFAVFTLK